jgi:release factor glutamine methyltransferase
MQKIKDIRLFLKDSLAAQYPESELRGFNNWILEYLFDYSSMDALMQAEKDLSDKNIKDLNRIITFLKQEKPIQQIVGYAWFYGHKFSVNEHVLIPRPETEELVDWILKDKPEGKSILDIGTGSGCIPITIALNSTAQVSTLDISDLAIVQAKDNAKNLNASINFIQADILAKESIDKLDTYDVIVSNPPYVLESDQELMENNVLDNEPYLALFVPNDDALKFYIAITDIASKKLNKNGLLYFEIHEDKGQETLDMLARKGFENLELRKDLQGKERMVKAVWKL